MENIFSVHKNYEAYSGRNNTRYHVDKNNKNATIYWVRGTVYPCRADFAYYYENSPRIAIHFNSSDSSATEIEGYVYSDNLFEETFPDEFIDFVNEKGGEF